MISDHSSENHRLGTLQAWLIWLCGALFYSYVLLIRVSPNVMTDELVQLFAIDATQLGLFSSFFYYSYVGMQLPLGMMMDKFGSERLIAVAAILLGAATALFAFSTDFYVASSARFLMGACSSCGWIGCAVIATRWFPPAQRSYIIGLTLALGNLGALLGGLPLEILMGFVGWQAAMKYLSLIGGIIGISLYLVARPTVHQNYLITSETKGSLMQGLISVASKPQCWLVASYAMLMYLPIAVIGDAWGISFLERTYVMTEKVATTCTAVWFTGIVLGAPFFAMLARKLASYKKPMLIGAASCIFLYSAIIFLPPMPLPLLYLMMFLAGFCFNSQLLCFSIMSEINPLSVSGVAMAFTNMIVMCSGIIGLPMIGWVIDLSSNAANTLGMAGYSATDFRTAFCLIPVCLSFTLLLAIKIKADYPKFGPRSKKAV